MNLGSTWFELGCYFRDWQLAIDKYGDMQIGYDSGAVGVQSLINPAQRRGNIEVGRGYPRSDKKWGDLMQPRANRLLKMLVVGATGIMPISAVAAESAAWQMVPGAPDAAQTDPVRQGVMRGNPPPPDKRVMFRNGSAIQFPGSRWSFNHWREVAPTKVVSRGTGPVQPLPRAERSFDTITFKTTTGIETSFKDAIDLMYTDGLLILHRGRIVYETYRGEGSAERPHLAFSVTKSFIGTLAAILVAEKKLDPDAAVTKYVPELKDSAYGDATVRQVMDMTIAAHFSEDYTDPKAEIRDYGVAASLGPALPDYKGPRDIASYLATIQKNGDHGRVFQYATVDAETLGWIVSRATGKRLADLLSDLVWSKIGAESDASISVDGIGTEVGGAGLNTTLRDLARFGEMMRNRGKVGGAQVVPAATFDDILKMPTEAEKLAFEKAGYKTLPGWTYRDMWWVSNNSHGAYSARGIFGQAIYIDPKAEMVVVRYASMPAAGNAANDPLTLPFYDAVAKVLMDDPAR